MHDWASDFRLRLDLGEDASGGGSARVRAAADALAEARVPGVADVVPAYRVLLVTIDPEAGDPEAVADRVRAIVRGAAGRRAAVGPVIEIPVCYQSPYSPDLDDVADRAGLTPSEVVAAHASREYRVAFLGFAPGFPYLEGLDPRLATPRLDRPRVRVPEGSVAIGGAQAGIYPFALPGGWRVVGRTPLRLFRTEVDPPALLAPGDRVRFVPIDAARFERMHAGRG